MPLFNPAFIELTIWRIAFIFGCRCQFASVISVSWPGGVISVSCGAGAVVGARIVRKPAGGRTHAPQNAVSSSVIRKAAIDPPSRRLSCLSLLSPNLLRANHAEGRVLG